MANLQRGFTLIELLLVVVIISLLTGLAVFSVGDRRVKVLNYEAQRLEAVLHWLGNEAVLQQRPYGLKVVDNGYQQLSWNYQESVWVIAATTIMSKVIALRSYSSSHSHPDPDPQPQKKQTHKPGSPIADIIFYPDRDFDEFALQLSIKEPATMGNPSQPKHRLQLQGQRQKGIHIVRASH